MARQLLTERELRDYTINLREKTVSEADAGYHVKPYQPAGTTPKDKALRIVDSMYANSSTQEIQKELDNQGLGEFKSLAVRRDVTPAIDPTKPGLTKPTPAAKVVTQPKPAAPAPVVTPTPKPTSPVAQSQPSPNTKPPASPHTVGKDPRFNQTVANMQRELVQRGYNLGATGPNHDGIDGVLGSLTQQAYDTEFGQKAMTDRADREALVKQTRAAVQKNGEITAIPDNTENPVEKERASQESDHLARMRQLAGTQQPMDPYQREAERKMHQYRVAADAKYGTNTANEVPYSPVTEQTGSTTTFSNQLDLMSLRKLANIEDTIKVPTMYGAPIKQYELKEYRTKR